MMKLVGLKQFKALAFTRGPIRLQKGSALGELSNPIEYVVEVANQSMAESQIAHDAKGGFWYKRGIGVGIKGSVFIPSHMIESIQFAGEVGR